MNTNNLLSARVAIQIWNEIPETVRQNFMAKFKKENREDCLLVLAKAVKSRAAAVAENKGISFTAAVEEIKAVLPNLISKL